MREEQINRPRLLGMDVGEGLCGADKLPMCILLIRSIGSFLPTAGSLPPGSGAAPSRSDPDGGRCRADNLLHIFLGGKA